MITFLYLESVTCQLCILLGPWLMSSVPTTSEFVSRPVLLLCCWIFLGLSTKTNFPCFMPTLASFDMVVCHKTHRLQAKSQSPGGWEGSLLHCYLILFLEVCVSELDKNEIRYKILFTDKVVCLESPRGSVFKYSK